MTVDDARYGSEPDDNAPTPFFNHIPRKRVRAIACYGIYALPKKGEKLYPLGELPTDANEEYIRSSFDGSGGLFALSALGGPNGDQEIGQRRVRLDGEVTWPRFSQILLEELAAERAKLDPQPQSSMPAPIYTPGPEISRPLYPGVHVLSDGTAVAEDLDGYQKQAEINRQRDERQMHTDQWRLLEMGNKAMDQRWNNAVSLLKELKGGSGGGASEAEVRILSQRVTDLTAERDRLQRLVDEYTKTERENYKTILDLQSQIRGFSIDKKELEFKSEQELAKELAQREAQHSKELAQASKSSGEAPAGGVAAGLFGAVLGPVVGVGAEGLGRGAAAALAPTLEKLGQTLLSKIPTGG